MNYKLKLRLAKRLDTLERSTAPYYEILAHTYSVEHLKYLVAIAEEAQYYNNTKEGVII